MSENQFKGTVEALFRGMDGVISSKTCTGGDRGEDTQTGVLFSRIWLSRRSSL